MKNQLLKMPLFLIAVMIALSACEQIQDYPQQEAFDIEKEPGINDLLEVLDNPNLRIMPMDWTCEEKCVAPNSTQAFRKRGEASINFGPHQKTVSYVLYNTFDQFVVEVNTATSDFDFKGMLRYSIIVNGQSFTLSNLKVGEMGKISIPLEDNYADCGLMEISIQQTGYGQTIQIEDDYNLVKKCDQVDLASLNIGDSFQGGEVLSLGLAMFGDQQNFITVVAPYVISQNAPWGCEGTLIDFSVGGVSPTKIIASQCDEAGTAAKLVAELEIDGFTDWELPSILELPPRIPTDYTRFWTSNQVNSSSASIGQNLTGILSISQALKSTPIQVMAVRKVYKD